ncbi:MAG: co-chaperone DjlA [Pseudomonadota bacterium]|nr:co-chaperone DjlA [Pseudomonadota bacterium]
MAWKGKFFGALIGYLITRNVWGAFMGAAFGHLIDQGGLRVFLGSAGAADAGGAAAHRSVSDVFFRTTFEMMGHVAKSDGRVTEAEIDAASQVMRELQLGPADTSAAIAFFRVGKSPQYDAGSSIEDLRSACALRHDLLRAFMELQMRAALAGNDLSQPARTILMKVAARLGMSFLEFAHMEAVLRARRPFSGAGSERARPTQDKPLAQSYAELEVGAGSSDQEVVKAYRRQMSRHHPDKLVANGLPESMSQVAKEKTQRIQEAYEAIRAARGMR